MIITLSHLKGGAGASTSTIMLGHLLQGTVLDLDLQGTSTRALRAGPGGPHSAYAGIKENDLVGHAVPGIHGGDLVPSDFRLSRLAAADLDHLVDLVAGLAVTATDIIIDTAGSADNLAIAAAKAADVVIVPTQLGDTDIPVAIFWIRELQSRHGVDPVVLATRVSSRLQDNDIGIQALQNTGARVLETIVPDRAEFRRIASTRPGKLIRETSAAIMKEIA